MKKITVLGELKIPSDEARFKFGMQSGMNVQKISKNSAGNTVIEFERDPVFPDQIATILGIPETDIKK